MFWLALSSWRDASPVGGESWPFDPGHLYSISTSLPSIICILYSTILYSISSILPSFICILLPSTNMSPHTTGQGDRDNRGIACNTPQWKPGFHAAQIHLTILSGEKLSGTSVMQIWLTWVQNGNSELVRDVRKASAWRQAKAATYLSPWFFLDFELTFLWLFLLVEIFLP